jgi:hypothetical protein
MVLIFELKAESIVRLFLDKIQKNWFDVPANFDLETTQIVNL